MKLDKQIIIVPPSYLQNDQIVHPGAIVLDSLNITYMDNPTDKRVYAIIQKFPIGVQLWGPENYDSVGNWTIQDAENKLKSLIGKNINSFLHGLFNQTGDNDPDGAGSILAGLFSAIGIQSSPTCSCKKHMKEMNLRGNDWCEKNIETIVSWLKKEAERRKLPFVETIARAIVKSSIKKSRRLLSKKVKHVKT